MYFGGREWHLHVCKAMCFCVAWVGVGLCTSAVDFYIHGQLGRHGQEVVLQGVLHYSLLLLCHHSHLFFRRFSGFQLFPQLFQGGSLHSLYGLGGGCMMAGEGDGDPDTVMGSRLVNDVF